MDTLLKINHNNDMKYTQKKYGQELNIDDLIIAKHAYGTSRYKIDRVTKNFCFSKVTDVYEAKFRRVYGIFTEPLPRQKWNTTTYEAYSPIEES